MQFLANITIQPLTPDVITKEHTILDCITSHNLKIIKKTSTNQVCDGRKYFLSC